MIPHVRPSSLVIIGLLLALGLSGLLPRAGGSMHGPADGARHAPDVQRPPIVGVAHIGLKTDNLRAARNFYHGVLGFDESFALDKPTGGLLLTYFKVNDHQYIEVFPELKNPTEDRLSHISFETTDAQRLRDYLAARG